MAEGKQKTVKLSIIIAVSLSIAFIVAILYFTVDPNTLTYLSSAKIHYEYFIAAAFINVLFWTAWGARMMVLANALDRKVHVGLWESTKIIIANNFLAGITPSMAGGEPVRIYLLNKNGLSLGGATAAVLGERLLDAIFLLCTVPFAFYIFKDKVHNYYFGIGLTIGIIIFIIGIILFLWIVKNPTKIKTFLVYLDKKLSRFSKKRQEGEENKIIHRINKEVDNFHGSMITFVKEGKQGLILGGILTAIMWSTGFMIPSFILMGLGLDPSWITSYAAQILLVLIVMMPTTPGSSGVTEGTAAILYSIIITQQSLLGVFVLLFRFISYHMNMIAGAIFQYRIFKSITSFSLDKVQKKNEQIHQE